MGEPGAGVIIGTGGGGIELGEKQYARVLHRRAAARDTVRDPGVNLRHAVE